MSGGCWRGEPPCLRYTTREERESRPRPTREEAEAVVARLLVGLGYSEAEANERLGKRESNAVQVNSVCDPRVRGGLLSEEESSTRL